MTRPNWTPPKTNTVPGTWSRDPYAEVHCPVKGTIAVGRCRATRESKERYERCKGCDKWRAQP